MPRYHFHIKGGVTLADRRGMDLPSHQEARKYAEAMTQTVSRSRWRQFDKRLVVVTDTDGKELFSVRVPARE